MRFVLEAQVQTTPIGMALWSNNAGLFLSMITRDVFSPQRGLCCTAQGMTA